MFYARHCGSTDNLGSCVGTRPVPPWAGFYPAQGRVEVQCVGPGGSQSGTLDLSVHWWHSGDMPACVPSREQLSHEGNAAKIR